MYSGSIDDYDLIKILRESLGKAAEQLFESGMDPVEFIKNYRWKINWTSPIGEYDPMDLLHYDDATEHIAMVYYINNSTGDTCIYNNINGNNAETFQENFNNVDYNSDFDSNSDSNSDSYITLSDIEFSSEIDFDSDSSEIDLLESNSDYSVYSYYSDDSIDSYYSDDSIDSYYSDNKINSYNSDNENIEEEIPL